MQKVIFPNDKDEGWKLKFQKSSGALEIFRMLWKYLELTFLKN